MFSQASVGSLNNCNQGRNKRDQVCEVCKGKATVYAMGSGSGDWGGRYCDSHIPKGFGITDRFE